MDNTKIFNILAILLGLRPFGRSLLGANARKIRTANLLQLLPSLGMLILYTLCLVSMLRTRDEAASIAAAANWLQAAPNAFAFIMVIIFALKNRDLGQEILDSFVMCDEKLRDYFGINYDKVNRVSAKMSILFVFVSITSGLTVAALTFYSAVDLSNSWTLFYWASFCLPKFTLMVFNFQFVGAISFLTSRTQLLRMAVRANLSGELDALLAQMSILGKHGNAMKVRPVDSVNPTSATLVADIVGILHNLCDRVNLYFGKQLILTFLSAFICVIVQMHYIINHIRHGFAMTDAEILVSFSLALVTMHAIEFWTVLHGGEIAKVKWNETMVVLTQARGNSSDDKLRSKINDILATMKVKKLEFHAFNFFTIDLSLLTAMISAMTTYLIVLVQFKISEDEKGGSSSTNPTKQFSVDS